MARLASPVRNPLSVPHLVLHFIFSRSPMWSFVFSHSFHSVRLLRCPVYPRSLPRSPGTWPQSCESQPLPVVVVVCWCLIGSWARGTRPPGPADGSGTFGRGSASAVQVTSSGWRRAVIGRTDQSQSCATCLLGTL